MDPFAWNDPAALRAFAGEVGFAHLFVAGAGGAAMAHVPMHVADDDSLHFHVPRRHRIAPLLSDGVLIACFVGADGYVSPDWYGMNDQVPTWNYRVVEAEGRATPLDRAALVAHLDALGVAHERRLAPKPEWTRAKMTPGRFDAMLPAITGYALHVSAWRGTAKLGQNKPAAAVRGMIAGLGDTPLSAEIAAANAHRLTEQHA